MMNKFKDIVSNLNNGIAVKTTVAMSTMWCVYVFTIWSLLPVAFHDLTNFCFYVSGGIIQLVALPLIMVGQKVMGAKAEDRAERDHNALMEEIDLLKQVLCDNHEMLALLHEVVKVQVTVVTD